MGVSVSVLASGSRGNSAIIRTATTNVLVDAGISCRETFKRIKAAGDDPHILSAILITHEHTDHVYGLAVLARKLNVPIFMTGATHQAWARAVCDSVGEKPAVSKLELFASGCQFQIGDIAVTPFTIPHDATLLPPPSNDTPLRRTGNPASPIPPAPWYKEGIRFGSDSIAVSAPRIQCS